MKGRLVPQDPTDEPAEKLLERIRQQRPRTASSSENGAREPVESDDLATAARYCPCSAGTNQTTGCALEGPAPLAHHLVGCWIPSRNRDE